ncbi:hypothetical protein [Pseudomonas sp. EMN2]|uniref:hypothetical protein n=1 Tax=Pseudomonas sp. EMN2 TaxID=2615212 RepID=UPI00129AC0D3|nr:hypothetical protein [Pseudomonas sp. EMN2]
MEANLPASADLRSTLESKFVEVLQLAPGFKSSAAPTKWAALLYAAIEPVLDFEVAPTAQGNPHLIAVAGALSEDTQAIRLQAVTEFCSYMIGQVDPDQRPNEFALEQWVAGWDKTNNGDGARKLPPAEVE